MRVPALASRHVCRPSVSERSLQFPVFKEHGSGFSAASVSNLHVCAQFRVAVGMVVGLGGLEPPASPLSGVRSNHLSYRPKSLAWRGGACRDRTDDPLLAKQVLSQLS